MAGQNKVRWEFQAERGGKKAESGRCHVAAKGDRHHITLPVNHEHRGKTHSNRNWLIYDVRAS